MNRNRGLTVGCATVWVALLGVWAGLAAAGIYFNTVDTSLRHFKGRIIGHAVAFGSDPALRIRAYVLVCAVALGAAAVVIMVLYQLQAWAAAHGQALLSRTEQRVTSLLALVGISDLTLYVLTAAPPYRIGSAFLLLCMLLLAAGPIIRLLARRSDKAAQIRSLGSPWTQGAILLLAYQLCVGVGVLMELPLILGPATLGRLSLTWLLLQAAVGVVLVRSGTGAEAGRAGLRLMRASLPLLWLPAVAPLANEIQFTLRTHIAWNPLALARVMALVLAAVAVAIWFCAPPRDRSARSVLRLLRRWYFPVVLVCSALLTLHRQTMTIDAVDVYHHGEVTTPVMQILQQGRIPYLETCLPHGFVDIVPQILFAALNGADRWDILIWGSSHWAGWLPVTAGLAMLYALLTTVASPLSALLLLLFLPAEVLFSCLNAPVIICVLALLVFLKHRGARRAWMLPASLLAVFLWRVDFGLAVMVAAAAVLVTVAWSGPRVRWLPVLVATGLILAATAAVAAGLAILRGISVGDAMHNFLVYVSMQVAVASYLNVYDKMSPLVVLQYLVLPAIGLLIVLYNGVRSVLLRQGAAPRLHCLMFLAVVSLVLFVRSLQRHSLFEGVFSPHLFLFLLAALPALLRPPRRALVSTLLVVVTVGAVFALPDSRGLPKDVKWPVIVGGPPRYTFRIWSGADQRVLVHDRQTDDVVRVLRAQLKPGETFYDFANAPLLYFLTGAVPPTFIMQTTYHASDDIQRAVIRDLETLRRAGRLPLVVFKQNTAFDVVDGIPNEIRSYRIAEYIYAHYVPWTNAGRFELWIDKRLGSPAPQLDTGLEGPVVARYPLPLRTPAATANLSRGIDTTGLTLTAAGEPAWAEGLFVLPEQVVWAAGLEYHLHLRCTTSARGILEAVFSFAAPAGVTWNSAEVVAAPTADDRPLDLRLPLRLGTAQPPTLTDIRLVLPRAATVTIQAAEVEVRRRTPEATPAWAWSAVAEPYIQQFDLFRLPYVWANFDDHDPVHTCAELQALHSGGPVTVAPGQDLTFPTQSASMESGQYLHLRLQADAPATVTVAYGDPIHPNSLSTQVQAAPEPHDHLIRMSTQRQWYTGGVTSVRLSSSGPVHLHTLRLLAGD